eukprot:6468383-Amphidinium_carterae.1
MALAQSATEFLAKVKPATGPKAKIELTGEDVGELLMKHKEELLKVHNKLGVKLTMQACGPFLMDVMKKSVRLSGKVLRDGALKVQWHNIVRNNIAFELEEAWKS